MKILTQVLIYSLIALAGIAISFYTPFALPSSILSMVILFLLLLLKVVKKDMIKEVSTFLIQVMALFFVTPVVSMVKSAAEAGDELIPIIMVSTLAMLITFSVSAPVDTDHTADHEEPKSMIEYMSTSPFFGISVTVLLFLLSRTIARKLSSPLVNEVILTAVMILLMTWLLDIRLDDYMESTAALQFMIVPATIALSYSIYLNLPILKKYVIPIIVGTVAGAVTNLVSVMVLGKLFGLSDFTSMSLVPKSVTTALAIELGKLLQGDVSIAILGVYITGFAGVLLNPLLVRLYRIEDPVVRGLSFGISAHVIGTTKAFEYSEIDGALSSVAIFFMGITTTIAAVAFL